MSPLIKDAVLFRTFVIHTIESSVDTNEAEERAALKKRTIGAPTTSGRQSLPSSATVGLSFRTWLVLQEKEWLTYRGIAVSQKRDKIFSSVVYLTNGTKVPML